MSKRLGNEFSRKVKSQAYARTKFVMKNGDEVHLCDGCQCELVSGKITYDHIKTIEEGGAGTLSNCQVLCRACDNVKTYGQDIPRIRKGDRQRDKHIGAIVRDTPKICSARFAKSPRAAARAARGPKPQPEWKRRIYGDAR